MTKQHVFPALLLSATLPLAGCSRPPVTESKASATESKAPATAEAGTGAGKTPLYGNLGDHHFPITTKSRDAQSD
jgi:hypothetical protein